MASKLKTILDVVRAAGRMREVARTARCACGKRGSWGRTVSGTAGGKPVLWMGCPRCSGQALGVPVGGEERFVAEAVIRAAEKLGIDIDDVIESVEATGFGAAPGQIDGPLALESERQAYASWMARRAAGDLTALAWSQESYLQSRRLEQRDIDPADVIDGVTA